MSEKVYPKGIRIFKKHDSQPDFVKGTVIITINEFVQFCKDNASLLTDYNGQKQLKCQLLDGNNGLYMQVDTYKPEPKQDNSTPVDDGEGDGLPF